MPTATMAPAALHELGVIEAATKIASCELAPVDLLDALLARIDAIDGKVKAWAYIDREGARAEAIAMGEEARAGKLRGPLHGVPVGLKDVFHIKGQPTIANSKTTDATPMPEDSIVAAKFRAAGALLMGKVTTVEFAGMGIPPETCNPWNLGHTAGGSSSGSGAAVGSRTVPVAIGTQTGGSNLRPAAYNGVSGFKGTYGRIGRTGCITVSYSMDHPGLIGRSAADMALVFSVIAGPDPRDDTLLPLAPPSATITPLDGPPVLGIVRDFFLEKSEPSMVAALESCAERMAATGARIVEVRLPPEFAWHSFAHRIVMGAEATTFHGRRYGEKRDLMSARQRAMSETHFLVPSTYYVQAQRIRHYLWQNLQALFTGVDALIMPTAPGPAPAGLESTGDASLLSPWTFIGYPSATTPAGISPEGLPLGMQIVARPKDDEHLFRVLSWAESTLGLLPPPPMFP